jgi:hypothetical protein
MRSWIFAVASIFPLGGCGAMYAQQDDAFCAKSGAPAGTPYYQQCRANMAQSRIDPAADDRNRAIGLALIQGGTALMAQPPPPPPPPPSLDPADHVCIAPNNTLYRC